MRKGQMVKIEDIGQLAVVVQPGRQMIKIEVYGEQFWIGRELVEVIKNG